MKEQLKLLLGLQELDLEADRVRSAKDEVDQKLSEFNEVLESLRSDLDTQRAQLDATEELHNDKTQEHRDVEERLKKSKLRLAKVSNTKEYAAIELEIENAKRQTGQLEEELAQLREAIDTTAEAIAGKTSKIEELTEQVALEGKDASSQIGGFDAQLKALSDKRAELATGITNSLIRRYDFIRSRRDGIAIVPTDAGCCQGCYMQLPPQLYIEVQRGKALKTCPSCRRILYFEGHLDDGDTEAATAS